MKQKSFYRFAYFAPKRKNKPLLPHQLRDGEAFFNISSLLFSENYSYEGVLLNNPAIFLHTKKSKEVLVNAGLNPWLLAALEKIREKELIGQEELFENIRDFIRNLDIDHKEKKHYLEHLTRDEVRNLLLEKLSHPKYFNSETEQNIFNGLNGGDLVVLTTRPPLDDEKLGENRTISRSYTPLEEYVFDSLRPYFKRCSRSRIELSEELCAKLETGYSDRAKINVKQNIDASYVGLGKYFDSSLVKYIGPKKTMVFFIRTPKGLNDKPQVLASFGMAGTYGMIWANAIRNGMPKTININKPRFLMAEITIDEIPLRTPDLSFARAWEIDIILDVDLPLNK